MESIFCSSQKIVNFPSLRSSIDYSIISAVDALQNSSAEVQTHDLYDQYAFPLQNGPLDRRLGIGNQMSVCTTCHEKIYNCVGHFGHLHLSVPIYHIGYFKHLVNILKMICKRCSRVLLEEEMIEKYRKKMMALENRYM